MGGWHPIPGGVWTSPAHCTNISLKSEKRQSITCYTCKSCTSATEAEQHGRPIRSGEPMRHPLPRGHALQCVINSYKYAILRAELTTDERNGREQRETRHGDPKRQHGANYGAGISCYTCTGIRAAMCNKLLQVDKRGADQTRSRKNWNRCGRDPGTAEQSRPRSGRQGITCYTCILWHYASTAL